MPHATSSGLDWPFRSRKRLEKKLADSAVREVTSPNAGYRPISRGRIPGSRRAVIDFLAPYRILKSDVCSHPVHPDCPHRPGTARRPQAADPDQILVDLPRRSGREVQLNSRIFTPRERRQRVCIGPGTSGQSRRGDRDEQHAGHREPHATPRPPHCGTGTDSWSESGHAHQRANSVCDCGTNSANPDLARCREDCRSAGEAR